MTLLLNAQIAITRNPDGGGQVMYGLMGQAADTALQYPGTTVNYPYIIATPADPTNGIFANIADATADFIANVLPTLPTVINTIYPSGPTYTGIGTVTMIPAAASRVSSPLTLSLVSTGATGTLISATKDSTVKLTVSTSATASITGAAVSTVALKICATNNTTEANWTTVATSETSQSYSLAIAVQGVTGMKEQISADVPAGWYVKLVNSGSGTHSESFLSGQQTIYA